MPSRSFGSGSSPAGMAALLAACSLAAWAVSDGALFSANRKASSSVRGAARLGNASTLAAQGSHEGPTGAVALGIHVHDSCDDPLRVSWARAQICHPAPGRDEAQWGTGIKREAVATPRREPE